MHWRSWTPLWSMYVAKRGFYRYGGINNDLVEQASRLKAREQAERTSHMALRVQREKL